MKLIITAGIILLSFLYNDPLTGRWESKPSVKGNVTGVVFKNDSILEGYVNKKPFTSGTYHFSAKDSVLSFTDNGCAGAKAVYKVIFFSKADSIRFLVVSDSCIERKDGMQRLILGRVTSKKSISSN